MALYTEDQKSHFKRVSQETVDLLNSLGYKAKVGTQQGLSYPAVREGAWTLALLWDDGKGWSCPGYSKFPGPHWHWFLSSNLENFGVSYATGISLRLVVDPFNPQLISFVMRFVLSDPCRVPHAGRTPNFLCPDCGGDWDLPQQEPGVFGKFMSPLVTLSVTEGSVDPEGWDPVALNMAFNIPE